MNKLEIAREKINKIDEQMAKLFSERMQAVKLVAEHKKENGLPVVDSSREQAVIEKNSKLIDDEEIRSYYVGFIKNNIDLSKQYQHKILEGQKIAYSGVEGAFANIAAKRVFPDGLISSYSDFNEAYNSVVNGECDCAVLPIENSYAGEVSQVMDLMFNGSLYINGVYGLKINQNLLGVDGANIKDIKTVISHPQALSQCNEYIKKNNFEKQEEKNTAVAAKRVANLNDKSVAAIASFETAELYGLNVIDHDINESDGNTTKFAVFSRVQNQNVNKKDNRFLLLFTVKHEAGALAKAVNVIGKYGFNMSALRSRPMKDLAWQYYFYVEAEGDETSLEGKKMLKELSKHCDKLKVVGHFSLENI